MRGPPYVWCKTLKRVISWHFLAKVQKMFSAYVINFLAYKSFLTAGNSWQEVPPAVKIPLKTCVASRHVAWRPPC